jgi:DNA-binding IscR family transcriptional regulator
MTAKQIQAIFSAISELVEITHKQVAAVWGLLTAAGVVGVPGGIKTGYALLAYAGLAHVVENLLHKSIPKASPKETTPTSPLP